jgi:hypothetical protein
MCDSSYKVVLFYNVWIIKHLININIEIFPT